MLQTIIKNLPLSKITKALMTLNTPFTARLRKELEELQAIANENELKEYVTEQLQKYSLSLTTDIDGIHLQLAVGQGGMDAEDCTQNIMQMYTNFLQKYKIKYEVLDASYTGHGISSSLMRLYAPALYPAFMYENGIHRTERISPFKSKKSIQTSETYVLVYPYIQTPSITLTPSELYITPIKSGGPGGQHANKNYTGIRAKHLPTGLTVTVTKYRSQRQNRETALAILKSKLQQLQNERGKHVMRIDDLQLTRTYDSTRDHIKSHIYSLKLPNLTSILKGNIELILLYNILYASGKSRTTH